MGYGIRYSVVQRLRRLSANVPVPLVLAAVVLWCAQTDGRPIEQVDPPVAVEVVALGDSITKGVRPGVGAEETFTAVLQRELKANGLHVNVINEGVGGERTDQALARLDAIAQRRPRVVGVMYGTNDSYVDQDQSHSRLSVQDYKANLEQIVRNLLLSGAEPILMTEPRWAQQARNGLDENPNERLAVYMQACRQVAGECGVALVDHFAVWTEAEGRGVNLSDWTTDGCHPNPAGHQQLAAAMLPVFLRAARTEIEPVDFHVELETVLEHDDGQFLWFHPRVTAIPSVEPDGVPQVVMTLQKHLRASDHYSGLYFATTNDLGRTWSQPELRPELDWMRDGNVDVAVADVTPMFDPASRRVIAIGAQVRYSADGEQLEDQPRANQTAYAVFDPATGQWSRWRRLEMPADPSFNFARCACAQALCEQDGSFLLPLYIAPSATQPFQVTVARCRWEGESLKYVAHSSVLQLPIVRGLCEPSLVRFQDRYFLTLRNDVKAYVTVSEDGMTYRPIKPWLFDDGQELGSYNTQQHWLSHERGLFLTYTRRGADNDHIFRHRAPLFIAQVDSHNLRVVRSTERVLVPQRGATLGNFGAARIDQREAWVTVSEGIWNEDARQRGATGALFLARVRWAASD